MSAPARTIILPSAFPADFSDLMTDVVKIEHQTGNNAYGEPTYANPIVAKCRIDYQTREVRQPDGLVRVASTSIHLAGLHDVAPQDRITLPDGRQPAIIMVMNYADDRGPLYQEILT